ncbi:MAG: hypothetical protein Q9174_004176 [Haloplaca sp. 1 TL-2023]
MDIGAPTGLPVPIIFLKNPSNGHAEEDAYTKHFGTIDQAPKTSYKPLYVPVLEHTFDLNELRKVLSPHQFFWSWEGRAQVKLFGAIIFTSQRAVEAFAKASDLNISKWERQGLEQNASKLEVPFYAVGPATAQSLEKVRKEFYPRCWIRGGEDAGTGEKLADLIIAEYEEVCEKRKGNAIYSDRSLLFLTGAKHRDIIPVKIGAAPWQEKVHVEEMIVYSTKESMSFASEIASTLESTADAAVRWIVVFSPTAGEGLLRALGWLRSGSNVVHSADHPCWVKRTTFVASIGPTTRDYMKTTFGFDVDVCAEKPSPEGVKEGVEYFMRSKGLVP